MLRMTNAASHQALEEGKRRLREFLESSDTGRQAMAMSGRKQGGRVYDDDDDAISMRTLDGNGRRRAKGRMEDEDEDEDGI